MLRKIVLAIFTLRLVRKVHKIIQERCRLLMILVGLCALKDVSCVT